MSQPADADSPLSAESAEADGDEKKERGRFSTGSMAGPVVHIVPIPIPIPIPPSHPLLPSFPLFSPFSEIGF